MFEGVLGIKKPTFGLDIGFNTMKVVQIKGAGKNAQLLSAAEVEIPQNVFSKEGIAEQKKLADKILEAMRLAKPHRISAQLVASALPESMVFTKKLSLPKMLPSEIDKNIPFQAKEFFPIPIEETYMDWQIVGNDPKAKKLDIFVIAAPKVLIDSLSQTIKMAGLELLGLETRPIALARSLIDQNDLNTYIIIDIGANTTELTCFDEKMVQITATAALGGEKIKADFCQSLKIINSEVVHLIKYYQNRLGKTRNFRKILLAGGGANIEKVAETLEGLIKIKTEIGLPLVKLKSYDPKFATALGLAMKEI